MKSDEVVNDEAVNNESKKARRRNVLKTSKEAVAMLINWRLGLREAKQQGTPIVWNMCMGALPPEILFGAGVIPLPYTGCLIPEAAQKHAADHIDRATELGFARDTCSFDLCFAGCAPFWERMALPIPDIVISTSTPCHGAPKAAYYAATEVFGVPFFFLDIPWNVKVADIGHLENHAVEYAKKELSRLLSFIEKVTGVRHDEERLRHAVALGQEADNLWDEIKLLRRAKPCPMGVPDEVTEMGTLQLTGTEDAVSFLKQLLEEVKERVQNRQGVVENEQFRILWQGPHPYHDLELLSYFEDRGSSVLVEQDVDRIMYPGAGDPRDPLDSLARKMIANFPNGIIGNRISLTKQRVIDYEIDGIVHFTQLGCRQYAGGNRMVADAIYDELGIPSIFLDGDVLDHRDYSKVEIRNSVDDFFEMLRNNASVNRVKR